MTCPAFLMKIYYQCFSEVPKRPVGGCYSCDFCSCESVTTRLIRGLEKLWLPWCLSYSWLLSCCRNFCFMDKWLICFLPGPSIVSSLFSDLIISIPVFAISLLGLATQLLLMGSFFTFSSFYWKCLVSPLLFLWHHQMIGFVFRDLCQCCMMWQLAS